ncbi:hypothetical protein EMIT043CA1_260071 [Pseudomonas brassicacearum]
MMYRKAYSGTFDPVYSFCEMSIVTTKRCLLEKLYKSIFLYNYKGSLDKRVTPSWPGRSRSGKAWSP